MLANNEYLIQLTTSSSNLDVQSSNTELLASLSDILSCQHGSVWRRLITVSLDLHSTSDSADRLTTTELPVSVNLSVCWYFLDVRKICNMDEGIVEGSEDTSDSEDQLACHKSSVYSSIAHPVHG